MKKALIGIAGIAVLTIAVVLFVNAGTGTGKTGKAATEVKADCGKCPSATTCTDAQKSETSGAAHAGCTEAKADSAKACCDESKTATTHNCGGCALKQQATK